jgi:hypothetical protein
VDLLDRVVQLGFGEAFLYGGERDGHPDRCGHHAQLLHRRQQRRPGQGGVRERGDGVRGRGEHPVADPPGP